MSGGGGGASGRRRAEAVACRGGGGRRRRRVGARVTEANEEGSARVNRGTRMRLSVDDKYRIRINAGSISQPALILVSVPVIYTTGTDS